MKFNRYLPKEIRELPEQQYQFPVESLTVYREEEYFYRMTDEEEELPFS